MLICPHCSPGLAFSHVAPPEASAREEKQEAGKSQQALGSAWAEMGHQEPLISEMHLSCILPTRNLLEPRLEPQMSPFLDPAVALLGRGIHMLSAGTGGDFLGDLRTQELDSNALCRLPRKEHGDCSFIKQMLTSSKYSYCVALKSLLSQFPSIFQKNIVNIKY